MDFYRIMNCCPCNNVSDEKVDALVKSMLENGWVGAPVLVLDDILITGSHRQAALMRLYEMLDEDIDEETRTKIKDILNNPDVSYSVKYIIEEWEEENPDDYWEFDNLGKVFEGTDVEQWKNEIKEW